MQTQEMEMREEARLQEANEGDTVQINKAALHKLLECLLKQKEDTAQENAILKMELKAYKEKFAESLAVLKKVSEELETLKKDIVPENARLKIELEAYKEKFAESLAMTKMVSEELDSRNHDFQYYKTKLEDVAKELHSTENILMSREKEIQILKSQVAEQLKTEMKSEIPSTKEDGYEKWKPKKGYTLKQYKLKMDKEKSRKAEIEKLTAVSIAVAQKLHESEKIRESLQIKLKLEKEKVFTLSKELDEIKEDEKTRKELKIREEKIGYELDIISDMINTLREEQEEIIRRKNEIQEMKSKLKKQNMTIRKLNKGNKRLKGILTRIQNQIAPYEFSSDENQIMENEEKTE